MKFSPSTNGFYTEAIHGNNIPSDAVDISNEQHAALLDGQSQGKTIVSDESGYPVLADSPPISPADEIKRYAAAVQSVLDAAAVSAGYDDIKTAVTYADEPAVKKFQDDGRAFRAWRSLCWEYCYTTLAEVESGHRQKQSVEEFVDGLPKILMP